MPPDSDSDASDMPGGHSTEETEGEEHRKFIIAPLGSARQHVPRDEARHLTWLSWQTNGRGHGLAKHKFNRDGTVREIHDPAPPRRRKPKAVSSKQWNEPCD